MVVIMILKHAITSHTITWVHLEKILELDEN